MFGINNLNQKKIFSKPKKKIKKKQKTPNGLWLTPGNNKFRSKEKGQLETDLELISIALVAGNLWVSLNCRPGSGTTSLTIC